MKTIQKKTVIISGVSGFIGRILAAFLAQKGYRIIGLSRNPGNNESEADSNVKIQRWNPYELDGWEKVLEKSDIIINLAGENISAFRWTRKKKKRILDSRVQSTKILLNALLENNIRPDLFVQVSGIHFYGHNGDRFVDENSPPGDGFLAEVSQITESLSEGIHSLGIRRILLRSGIVWGLHGGGLPKLLLPFKLFAGGRVGSGKQWISWIHYQDLCRAIEFLISQPKLTGPVNVVSPQPVQNHELTKLISKILKRPAVIHIPSWVFKLFMGEMGKELLLSSLKVFPGFLMDHGFIYSYPSPEESLLDLLR